MKALVLGGSKFVGFRLVKLLVEQGHDVTLLNRGETPADHPSAVKHLRADRSDAAQVKEALREADYDAVFDISAYTLEWLKPTMEVLEGRTGSYVFASSTAVYGYSDVIPIREDYPVLRDHPTNQYAREKVACEDFIFEAHQKRGFPGTVLRPAIVYGPYNNIPEREIMNFVRILKGRKVIIPGDGLNLMTLGHVDDLAAAFAAVPGRKQAQGQAYTITGPEAVTANHYIRTLGEIAGREAETYHMDRDAFNALGLRLFPYMWMQSNVFTLEKAKRDLDWEPRYHFREGMETAYHWFQEEGLIEREWDFSAEDKILAEAGA